MKLEIPKIIERFGGSTIDKLNRLIDNRLSQIHTTTIGVIESFDSSKQLATIQPAIKKLLVTENQEVITYETVDYPLLVNVPVVFPGGGDWFMTFPVKKGDECLIFSLERSIGNWKKNGGIQDPSSYKRRMSFKDAVAMVGIQSQASSLPSFNASEPELRNRDGSVKLTMGSAGMTLEGDLQVNGKVTATGDVQGTDFTTGTLSFTGHTHPTAPTGPTSGPIPYSP